MKELTQAELAAAVGRACTRAAVMLPPDVAMALECACDSEPDSAAQDALLAIYKHFHAAALEGRPVCAADAAVVFIPADLRVTDGTVEDAVRCGAADILGTYADFVLQQSADEQITVLLRTAEDCACYAVSDAVPDAEAFVRAAAREAAARADGPLFIGVGLAGTEEEARRLSMSALVRPVDVRAGDGAVRSMEKRVLSAVNALGIGPRGRGGKYTAIAVNIETAPDGAASACAVSVSGYALRRAAVRI